MELSELIIKDERVDYMDYDHSGATTENASLSHQQRETDSNAFHGTTTSPTQSSSNPLPGNTFIPWKIIKREKAAHNQTNFINQPSTSQNENDDEDPIPVFVISEDTETDPLTPEVSNPIPIPITKKAIPAFQLRIGKKLPYECAQCGKQFQYNSQLGQHVAKSHKNSKFGLFTTNPTGDPTNPCDICLKKFKTPTALGLHRRSHFRVKITICKICGLEFNDLAVFETHKLTHVGQVLDQKPKVSCEICGKQVAGNAQLAKHSKIHSKTYPCNFCELIFQTFEDLTSHKIIHKTVNVCPICNESIVGLREFQIHKKTHDPNPDPDLSLESIPVTFSCKICSIDFENLELSTEHKNKHAAENFACNICQLHFKGIGPLYNHTKMHRRAQEHSCPYCPRKFFNLKEFQIHEKTHGSTSSSAENKIFSCPICKKVVSAAGPLSQHMKIHNSKPRTCPVCGKHFKFASLMEGHLKSHFRPLKIYTCDAGDDECRQTFNTSSAWRIHKKTAHPIDKKFSCDICGKVVSGLGPLKMHKRMHSEGKVRECIFCKKTFKFACLLYQHLKIHSKPEREYTCVPCNQTFTSFGDYRQHRKTHVGLDDKVHNCQICSKSFKFASLLRLHLKRHNGGGINKLLHKRGRYKCDICTRVLKGPAQLAMHKRSHANKVYPCRLCDAIFHTYDLLQDHRLTHTAEVYACDICGKEVSGSGQLAMHKRSHDTVHQCGSCDLKFSSSETLVEHKRSVHRSRNICSICGEIIMGNKEFSAHKKIHIILTHSCKICAIDFGTAEDSEEHKKIHIASNFACDVCGLDGFKGFGPLFAHSKMHRRAAVAASASTSTYSCEECDQTFAYSQELTEHRKIHKEMIEYSCDICKKVVAGSNQLSQHRKTHFRAQYTCKICGQVITGLSQISAHKNKHGMISIDDEDGTVDLEDDVEFVPSGDVACAECGKTFKYPCLLTRHMESHTKPKPVAQPRLDLKCSECPGLTFMTRRNYETHRKEHNIGRVFECKVCGKILGGQGALSQHVKSHNPALKTCPECGRIFKYAYMLTVHLKSHLKPQRVYNCTECDSTFTQCTTYRIHKRIHNSVKVFECDECPKVMNGRGAYIQHKKSHLNSKLCACVFCGKKFKFASTLLKHLEIHSKPEREFPCRNCDEIFTNFNDYRAHRKTHLNDKLHSCEICGKTFKFASSLKGHSKTHLNKDKYFCGHCDLNFEFAHELKAHRKTEHVSQKIFECDICGKICNGASPLIMHKKMHQRARFKCDVCGRVLKGSQQLAMHKRSHDTTNKVYRCKLCPEATFETNDLLNEHKATHATEEYICDLCGKEVSGSGQLKQHRKAHSTIHKCTTCDLEFAYALELQEHKKIHRTVHTCEICGESIVGIRDFQIHKRSHIQITHSCKICSIDFDTIEESEEHKKVHVAANFACDVCGLHFKGFGPLLAHKRMHRRTESYSCDKCEQTFKYAQELIEHTRKSHKVEVEEYSCNICKKVVKGSSQLKQHEKTHFRSVYNCKICGEKVTGSQGQITLHKRSHRKEQDHEEGSESEDEDGDMKYEPNVSLECPECQKTFKFPSILRRHMRTHAHAAGKSGERSSSMDDKNWECETCGKTLKGPKQLAQHIKTHDPSTRSCPVCGKLFKFACLMTLHLKTHSRPQKIYNCEECGETCTTSVAWRAHKKTHNPPDKIQCSLCTKVVSGKGQLVRHMKFHTEGKARTCLLCGKVFKFACLLATHLKVHSKPEREYSCSVEGCGLTFKTSADFKDHRKVHNNNENDEINNVPKIHACEVCGKSFKFACLLKVHSKIHLDRGNKFFCRDCDRTFEFAHELRNHRKIHVTQKIFDCDVCQKTFGSGTALIMHKKMHQRARYKCDICERVLKGSQQLTMHRKSHDSNNKTPRVFPCKLCTEKFETNDLLQEHRSTHASEKYVCDLCGKEVSGSGQLKQHMKSHSTIHKCKTCELEFPSWNTLKEHRKMAHRTSNTCEVCGETILGVKEFAAHKKIHIILKHSCKICSIDFETVEQSEEHKQIHIAANFACAICGLDGFKGFGPLLGHTKMHRRTETYSCDECDQTFKYSQELTEHYKKVHKETPTEYSCDICNKILSGSGQLQQHRKTHSKRTFECLVCGKICNSQTRLTLHHKKSHSKRNNKNIVHDCKVCGKIFKYKYLVDKHEMTHSKSKAQEISPTKVISHFVSLLLPFIYWGLLKKIPREHVCPECEAIFDHAHELRTHSRILHNKRPLFSCHSCDKTFERPLEFMNHKKVAHAKPKHVCFCGVGYSVLSLLRAHERSVHSMEGSLVPQVSESVPMPTPSILDTPEQ